MSSTSSNIFRPTYAPPGMTFKQARAAGVLRHSAIYWIRYHVHGRKVRESTQSTRFAEARRLLNERRRAADRGEPIRLKANRVTFSEMAEHLRADYRVNGKHLRTLEARLVHLEPVFGLRRMVDIGLDDVSRYKDERLAAAASNGTINRELEVLARAFTYGQALGLLTVALPVRRHRLAEAHPREGFFEDAAYHAIVGQLPPDLQTACAIAQALGWRMQSEVLALERRHLDLHEGSLRLDPGMAKNDEPRVAYLTPALTARLTEQLARVDRLQRQLGRVIPYLFPHLRGRRLQGQRIQDFRRAWRTACRKAGLPGMLVHDFRRTAVRNLVNASVPEKVAMQITGHKTRSVFDRYHIISSEDLRAAAVKLAGRTMGQVLGPVEPQESQRG
jgi:integrase